MNDEYMVLSIVRVYFNGSGEWAPVLFIKKRIIIDILTLYSTPCTYLIIISFIVPSNICKTHLFPWSLSIAIGQHLNPLYRMLFTLLNLIDLQPLPVDGCSACTRLCKDTA